MTDETSVMTDETANKVRGGNGRLCMKTLISADDLLIWREDEKESEGILILCNLTIKQYVLKMNMEETTRFPSNKDINSRITVNKMVVKQANKFIWEQK
jgi:hypothetical protein